MKNIFYILSAILFLASCSPSESYPTDLAGKKALLTKKKAEIKAIEGQIDTLKAEILKLEPRKEKDPILVSSRTLAKENFERFTTVQASVMTDDMAYASSETGGRILSVNAKEGQYVKKGQLLASVDLSTINDQMAEVQTTLNLARDVYDRQKRLWDQKIGTEIQFLQAKNNVERLEKTLSTMNSQLAKANVYSPISGVIDMEMLKAGEMAGPGTPILQILNPSSLKVVADVPESFLKNIKRGDKVDVFFPAIDKNMTKRVSLLGRTIDPSNRTFKVEVNVGNPGGELKPNLLAEIKFNDFSEKDVVTVPLNVILEDVDGSKYVYIAEKSGEKKKAKKRYIKIGESYENNVIVTEGLSEGDEVIIDGARSVSEGDPVVATAAKM